VLYFYCDATNDCNELIQQRDVLNNTSTSPLFLTLAQVSRNPVFVTWSD
jgi:hypothetical protein